MESSLKAVKNHPDDYLCIYVIVIILSGYSSEKAIEISKNQVEFSKCKLILFNI